MENKTFYAWGQDVCAREDLRSRISNECVKLCVFLLIFPKPGKELNILGAGFTDERPRFKPQKYMIL